MAGPGGSSGPGGSGPAGGSAGPGSGGGGGPSLIRTTSQGSQEFASIERRRQAYEKELVRHGMSPSAARASARTWAERKKQFVKRPQPFLGVLGRVLETPERAGAGFLRGVSRGLARGDVSPVSLLTKGAIESGRAVVREDRYGYGELLSRQYGIDKGIAGPVGFGMSLVFDPTMYISFGATSGSRIVASRLLREAATTSQLEARAIMTKGDGIYKGTKFTDEEDLLFAIHRDRDRPFDLAQALDATKQESRKFKRAARRGEEGETPWERLKYTTGGYLLPTGGKGGRGVRFAGMRIPGTGELGATVARSSRERARRAAMEGKEGRGTLVGRAIGSMSPRYHQRLMMDDLKRSVALTEMRHLADDLQAIRLTTADETAELMYRLGRVSNEAADSVTRRASAGGGISLSVPPEGHVIQAIQANRQPLYSHMKTMTDGEVIEDLFVKYPQNIPKYKAGIGQWRSEAVARGGKDPMPNAEKLFAKAEKRSRKANKGKQIGAADPSFRWREADPEINPSAVDPTTGYRMSQFIKPTVEDWEGAVPRAAILHNPESGETVVGLPAQEHAMLMNDSPAMRERFRDVPEDELWDTVDADFPVQAGAIWDPDTGESVIKGSIRDPDERFGWRPLGEPRFKKPANEEMAKGPAGQFAILVNKEDPRQVRIGRAGGSMDELLQVEYMGEVPDNALDEWWQGVGLVGPEGVRRVNIFSGEGRKLLSKEQVEDAGKIKKRVLARAKYAYDKAPAADQKILDQIKAEVDAKYMTQRQWEAKSAPATRRVPVETREKNIPLGEFREQDYDTAYQSIFHEGKELDVPKEWTDYWRQILKPDATNVEHYVGVSYTPPGGVSLENLMERGIEDVEQILDVPSELDDIIHRSGGIVDEAGMGLGKQMFDLRFPTEKAANDFAKEANDRLNRLGVSDIEMNTSKLVKVGDDEITQPDTLHELIDELQFNARPTRKHQTWEPGPSGTWEDKVMKENEELVNDRSIPPGAAPDDYNAIAKWRAFNQNAAEHLAGQASIKSTHDKMLLDHEGQASDLIRRVRGVEERKQAEKKRLMTSRERAAINLDTEPIIPLYHGTFRENFEAMDSESGWLYLTPNRQVATGYADIGKGGMAPKTEPGFVHEFGLPIDAKVYDARQKFKKGERKWVVEALSRAADNVEDQRLKDYYDGMKDLLVNNKLRSFDEVRRHAFDIDNQEGLLWDDGLLEGLDDAFKDVADREGFVGMQYRTPKPEVERYKEQYGLQVKPGLPEYAIWNQAAIKRLDEGPHGQLRKEINERVAKEIEEASAWGISKRESTEMWRRLQKNKIDPFEAIGEFVFRNRSKINTLRFIDRIVDNPLLSKPLKKGWENQPFPVGYKRFMAPDRKQYAVLSEMAEYLEDLKNPVIVDKGISDFLNLMNAPQQFWKKYATSPNPSFHVMNALGAVWNNMAGGNFNPEWYIRSIAQLYKARNANLAARGVKKGLIRRRVPKIGKGHLEAQELVREAQIRGGLGRGTSIFAELTQGEELESLIEDMPGIRERIDDLYKRRPGESRKRTGVRMARRGAGVAMAAHANPLALAMFAPEAAKAGRKLGSAVEDTVRLAPFMASSKDPVVKRLIDAYGPISIPGNHHPHFSKATQSAMYDIGANISRHFQFDYTDLTNFERKLAKTVFPFYTYYRKNFVLQARMLAEAPRQTATALKVATYMNDHGDEVPNEMQDLLPEYFDNIGAFQIPVPDNVRGVLGLPKNEPLFLNPKLPYLALNLFPPIWTIFQDTGQPNKQKVGALMAPVYGSVGPWGFFGAKPMLEATVGEMLGLNKTMDYQRAQSNDWRNSWVPAPGWVKYLPQPVRDFMGVFPWGETVEVTPGQYMMTATGQYVLESMSTPFITNLGHAIPVGGPGFEGGKARADMVSWMTGVRLIPMDTLRMHRSWAYRLRSMLESERQDLRDQGKELPPEDRRSLRMVRRQLRILERAWDKREKELYGS